MYIYISLYSIYGCLFYMLLFNFVNYVVMFVCSYFYVCSLPYILFSPCPTDTFGYPDSGFSAFFPQL